MKTATAILLLSLCPALAEAAGDLDQSVGDALQFVVPASALSISYLKDDAEGEKQWLRNTAASLILTHVSKLAFNHTSLGERPSGGHSSFPSGHTALAASGAAFLTERYGWCYGGPAWLVTGYVAYNRVAEREHRWRDVIAGAALSYGVSKFFVTPQSPTHLAPVVGPDFIGLRWERSW